MTEPEPPKTSQPSFTKRIVNRFTYPADHPVVAVTGFDQTIVQTLIILAMAVTGVVVIVRNSLALAFSLAGIVVH